VRHGFEEDFARDPFHVLNGFPESALIVYRLLERPKLFGAQGYGNGFAGDLAGPLVTAARGAEFRAVQHRTLADVADLSQTLAQLIVLAL